MNQSSPEERFIRAVQGMLRRPDYLIPLAAAERQFRDHYYGLNAAALLEDLFYDALGNFLRQTQPTTSLTRPKAGQAGWDYAFDGLKVSHKISQGLGVIAVLWDATRGNITKWSAEEPILYVLGRGSPALMQVTAQGQQSFTCRPAASLTRPGGAGTPTRHHLDGRALLVVSWPAGSSCAEILDVVPSAAGQTAQDALPFSRLWRHVAQHVANGGSANEVEVLATNVRSERGLRRIWDAVLPNGNISEDPLTIEAEFRGGAYLLAKHNLQNLAVTTNNRGVLIAAPTVRSCLKNAKADGHFAPLPVWYWLYADNRPPDMYSAQRTEYEARFSARGDLDLS